MTRPILALFLVTVALVLPGDARRGSSMPSGPGIADAATSTATIVATYGVGGVLKSDGRLYQWRPERRQWVTIDESFKLDGETRRILPLPVMPSEVVRMEGFGFIVTRSGTCWLYDLDANRWENIGRP